MRLESKAVCASSKVTPPFAPACILTSLTTPSSGPDLFAALSRRNIRLRPQRSNHRLLHGGRAHEGVLELLEVVRARGQEAAEDERVAHDELDLVLPELLAQQQAVV